MASKQVMYCLFRLYMLKRLLCVKFCVSGSSLSKIKYGIMYFKSLYLSGFFFIRNEKTKNFADFSVDNDGFLKFLKINFKKNIISTVFKSQTSQIYKKNKWRFWIISLKSNKKNLEQNPPSFPSFYLQLAPQICSDLQMQNGNSIIFINFYIDMNQEARKLLLKG